MSYWTKKQLLSKKAVEHTEQMKKTYKKEIEHSIKKTKEYSEDFSYNSLKNKKNKENQKTTIRLEMLDSVSAIVKYGVTLQREKSNVDNQDRIAVLNFASFKHPGGYFIGGSSAQEEALCHESFLYNVLYEFKDTYYKKNLSKLNNSLYANRALYSPDIIFNDNVKCDVITCACPNKRSAQMYHRVNDKENTKVLESRIRFVLDIAKDNNVDILILGAYGSGVFGQNPEEVANIFFKLIFEDTHYKFKKIIFAIPSSKKSASQDKMFDKNYLAFKNVFELYRL